MKIKFTKSFLKDFKKLKKKHYDVEKINTIIHKLENYENNIQEFVTKYKDHALKGNWQGFRELHIEKNLLLIYQIDNDDLILTLIRLGKHEEIL